MMIETKRLRIRAPQEKLINIPKEATEAASVLERLLENQLIGIYLYGSAILGGLHVNSDVDILALCKESLSEAIRGELTKNLRLG
ncbi:MAG: nucleotidyltransferase domain-containing protein [Cellulosilyticaceae bacterium]